MPSPWRLENIQRLREEAGIDDVELQKEVGKLAVGDIVHLTILDTNVIRSGEVIDVEIQEIRGLKYRGVIVKTPSSPARCSELANQMIAFTREHIHSVPSHNQIVAHERALR